MHRERPRKTIRDTIRRVFEFFFFKKPK